ncbi:MAG: hypothetical protein EMLJLAPB_00311 [Candidatus Argoarchaeum ethanivorans]|uniref:Uncharacterized protein n=1 Tax=Candidatus Argoarchaeum ethanivorans TaxID=2608793 RepID=A0A811T594_9EURY|nr:MAG: hypothetical protein KFBDDELM_00094 [Candidatus Argoarchaeum ethanivorans]CAD6490743.1 MAG: hypothetical protein FFODKBPE_00011 [Candidatus Argoarchaeum ethanivorans]CAD6492529.1 MAG: hypothetical protein EMLJLAPB_00311 [Candidatus Argoarchaeum ethanivorans]
MKVVWTAGDVAKGLTGMLFVGFFIWLVLAMFIGVWLATIFVALFVFSFVASSDWGQSKQPKWMREMQKRNEERLFGRKR